MSGSEWRAPAYHSQRSKLFSSAVVLTVWALCCQFSVSSQFSVTERSVLNTQWFINKSKIREYKEWSKIVELIPKSNKWRYLVSHFQSTSGSEGKVFHREIGITLISRILGAK